MRRNNPVYLMTFCAIAVNIVLGIVTSLLKLPFYLDTLGTILTAVMIGPLPGAIVGALTNTITGFIYSMRDIPFALVSIAVALIAGFIAKQFKFNLITAIVTGLILSIVAPLIGTPIGIALYGGLTGTVSDVIVMALKKAGASLFTASFVTKIGNNLIDKVGTCLVTYLLIISLPASMKSTLKGYATKTIR